MTATTLHLGYATSGIVFAALFTLPMVGYTLFKANEVVLFWIAYALTRPFGASFADWVGKGKEFGGLGIGTGVVSLILTILIIGFVGYLTLTHKDPKRALG